jgi:ElaB/YqjD/DUF883 family membrane-anchored ribosome-binding protein
VQSGDGHGVENDNTKETKNTMKKHATHARNDLRSLAEDAQTLLTATTDVAGDKVAEARKRLIAAIEKGKETWINVHDKAVEGTKAADHVIRHRPYQAIEVAFGVGTILGFLLSVRN